MESTTAALWISGVMLVVAVITLVINFRKDAQRNIERETSFRALVTTHAEQLAVLSSKYDAVALELGALRQTTALMKQGQNADNRLFETKVDNLQSSLGKSIDALGDRVSRELREVRAYRDGQQG